MSIRTKALEYLRRGNVRVIRVVTPAGTIQPQLVEAIVRGFNRDYRVILDDGVWSCPCDLAREDCAHRASVQLVTGHTSAAAR
jgi:hypothetical protein